MTAPDPSPVIPVLILAAGQSSRMRGRDKLLETVDGVPLLRRQAAMARAVTAAPVIVALPPRPHPRYDALAGLDVTLLEVVDAAEGMNATLRAGVLALPRSADAVAVLLADLPALTEADLRQVLDAVDPGSDRLIWRGATTDGKPGHPVVFSAALFSELTALRGDDGAQSVVSAHADAMDLIALPGRRARRDLDTPEDWAAWRAETGQAEG